MKKKCFAMGPAGCAALWDGNSCIGCPFCKSSNEAGMSIENAWVRMRALPLEKQREYADRYYDGKMPWSNETGVFG